MDDIQRQIGTTFIDTYGGFCLEVVNAGYKLEELYDGGKKWGDFTKVLLAVAVVRGIKSYDEYLDLFEGVRQADDKPATKQMFARFSGISTAKASDQVAYNKTYRHKTRAELDQLRALNAMRWIDDNTEQAKEYIAKITPTK